MKRNNLTTAVVAGIAGVAGFAGLANAVDLNPDGLGQVLIYPYYTVNKSQDTLISVVNTTDVGKAVKVRFLEGYNSREVLDFNLFLSAHDVWTADVSQTGDAGGGQISTHDHSCTYPQFPNGGVGPVAFRTAAFDGTGANPADSGPHGVTRTREGYLEIISMGDIVTGSPTSGRITHAQTGVANEGTPPGCSGITNTNVQPDLVGPTGGLFGSGSVVNVGQGTFAGYTADAIDGFTTVSLYSTSSDLNPSLQDATSPEATNGVARAYVFVNGQLAIADYANGIDAVSAVFMSDAIYNEYLVNTGLGANTDWVVTFTTKRFYVDSLYGVVPRDPFVEAFTAGESNVTVVPSMYDQEEGFTSSPDDFSPPISTQPNALPFEVNVISFLTSTAAGDPSGVLGSLLRPNINPYGAAGWLKLDLAAGDGGHFLPGGIDPTTAPVTFQGLPVTGFMVYDIINANAQPGLLANYAGLFRHRASRSCTTTTPGTVAACS
jgi:hypothetical protein